MTHPEEPNEFGFAGGATAPQPDLEDRDDRTGERIAVPADDLTGAMTGGLADATTEEEDS